MVRNYMKKTTPKYSHADLVKAMEMVTNGESTIFSAAKTCNVPKETLRRRLKGDSIVEKRQGRHTVLSAQEEEALVGALQYAASCGFPQDSDDIKEMVRTFCEKLDRKNPFKAGVPGKEWILAFKKRHAVKLSQRKPEILTKARSEALTEQTVDSFHESLKQLIEDNNIVPESIYNLDETGLNTNPVGKKVFVNPKSRDTYLMNANAGKAMYSVLFCVSAVGRYLPPFVVYKGKYLYSTWTESGPAGCRFAVSPSGWMHDNVFENWFMEHFIPFVTDDRKPVLVLYDGHGNHLTFETVEAAMQNNVHIHSPNCSHALQPLDVAVFKPLKVEWKKILKRFSRESRLSNVDKSSFPGLLKQLCIKLNPLHAISGFRNAGIVPLDKEKMKRRVTSVSDASDGRGDSDSQANPSTPPRMQIEEEIMTPNTAMREAVKSVIAPKPSKETMDIMKNKKAQRKRVQSKNGEVLTTEEVKKRLRLEEVERYAKKNAKKQKEKSGKEDMQEARAEKDVEIFSDDEDDDSDQPIAYPINASDVSDEVFSLENLPRSLQDIQCYLNSIWKALSPPVREEEIKGSWYAAIFANKRKSQLYIGKLTQRFLFGKDGMVEKVELEELKPKSGGGTDLEQPPIGSRSFGVYNLEDVIAGPLELVPIKNGYKMELYPSLIKLYTMVSKLDRKEFI